MQKGQIQPSVETDRETFSSVLDTRVLYVNNNINKVYFTLRWIINKKSVNKVEGWE